MNWISMNLISNTLNIYESNLLSWPVHLTMEKLNDPNHEVYYCDQMMPQCFNKEYQQLKMYQNRQICTCHSSGWSVGHTNRPGSKPNFYLKSCVIDSLQVLVTCHIKQQQCSVILICPEVSLLLPNMDFLPQSTLFSSLCKWLQRLVQVHGREIVWGGKLSKGELVCCSQFSSARGSWPESKFGEYIWVALVIVILLQCIISSNSWESVLAHLSHSRNSSLQRQEGLMN